VVVVAFLTRGIWGVIDRHKVRKTPALSKFDGCCLPYRINFISFPPQMPFMVIRDARRISISVTITDDLRSLCTFPLWQVGYRLTSISHRETSQRFYRKANPSLRGRFNAPFSPCWWFYMFDRLIQPTRAAKRKQRLFPTVGGFHCPDMGVGLTMILSMKTIPGSPVSRSPTSSSNTTMPLSFLMQARSGD
jgi:hypothetical protein